MDAENQQKELQSQKVEAVIQPVPKKSPFEIRSDRISEIDSEIRQYNYKASSPQEIEEIQTRREDEFQKQISSFGDLDISAESKELIRTRMVDEVVGFAQKDNEKFNELQKEKALSILYNNMELDDNAEELINNARKAVEEQDTNGEKIIIFDETLEYYSKPAEKIADILIYHGTGSSSLYKILEEGALDSSRNKFGGEKGVTGKSHGGTSFAIGGYEQSEMVSHLYARMNERKPRLVVDSKSIFGDNIASGKEMMDIIYRELPKLKPEERQFVEEKLKMVNTEDAIKLFDNEKYYFDYEALNTELQESREKLEGSRGEITDEAYKEYLEKRVQYLENEIKGYDNITEEEKRLLGNPFGVVLVYDGNELPKEDLETFTTAGICERRTNKPISNLKIKQIHAPYCEISQITEWINKKIQKLPENSEERKALENVKIIPLEYFEIKSIIKNKNCPQII